MQGKILELNWSQAKAQAKTANSKFAKVVDKISPDKDFSLYKIIYPYGATIVDKGIFHLPLENGEIVPITDTRVSKKVQADFAYARNGIPVGIVLKNGYEVFINAGKYILPIVIANPGSFIALWKQLDAGVPYHPINIFNITAGARSIFMLPNVSDMMMHKNLIRDFNVGKRPPKELLDQWQIFKAISDHENCNWGLEILLLSGKWLEKARTDSFWHELYLLFLETAWQTSGFERNQIFYEFALSCAQENKELKANPYLLDTARHLFSIALGSTPGFKPATDEALAPIRLIQAAYVESYDLKKYDPILMHPTHFNPFDPKAPPVYYSSQLPTTLSFSPRSRKMTSILFDLKDLKYIISSLCEEIAEKQVHLEDTLIDMIPKMEFDYFHSKPDVRDGIRSSAKLPEEDNNFCKILYDHKSGAFPYNGTFARGSIRIRHKNE